MEKIYFATTNENKLDQARVVLDGKFEIEGLKIDVPETGLTCEENAIKKLKAGLLFFPDVPILIADDYSINVEGITLGNIFSQKIIKKLVGDCNINIEQAIKLPFPGVFANRVFKYLKNEKALHTKISKLSINKISTAKIALAIHKKETESQIINVSTKLILKKEIVGEGWFWKRVNENLNGLSCNSEKWLYKEGVRAKALEQLANSL